MEDFLRQLFGEHITLAWIFLIIAFCWITYIPGRRNSSH